MASIAEILLAQGRSARDARMARGGVWAPLVQQLSNLPAAILQDRDQRRAAEAQAQMQAEDREISRARALAELQGVESRNAESERTAAARTAKIEILSNAVEEDGSFNLPKAMALVQERGWGGVVDPEDLKTWDQQYDQQAYARARQVQQDDRQLSQDRQAENQRGVRRMIGESIQSRGGQPLSPQEAQTYQGMAFQEGLTLPEGLMPQPEEEVSMVVRGPGGRPTRVLVPKSQLRNGGMEEYREPTQAAGPRTPIWVMKDGKFIDLAGVAPPGSQPANTREQGRPVISGDANTMTDLNSSLDDVTVLRAELFPVDPRTGQPVPGAAKATGFSAQVGANVPNAVTEFTGWGADAKAKQSVIDRVKQVIGKALEGGVLRKEDEYKYTKILPTISDPPSLVKSKIDGLEQAIKRKRQTFVDALSDAGYDTTRFQQRLEIKVNPNGNLPTGAPQDTGRGSSQPARVYYDADGNPIRR